MASATVTGLIHVYSILGAQRGHFGWMKHLDNDPRENQFLNQGIVMAGADGGFFYAFANAPQTTVQRFTPSGALVNEFPVYGRSLESHAEEARAFLTSREPYDVGGFRLITAGDFNEPRGTLLLATTARSAGWEAVYEYTADGTKTAEYSLVRQDGTEIHSLRDLVARGRQLTVLDDQGVVHAFVLPTLGPFAARLRAGSKLAARFQPVLSSFVSTVSATQSCPAYITVTGCETAACTAGGQKRDCKAAMCLAANLPGCGFADLLEAVPPAARLASQRASTAHLPITVH